MTTTDAEHLTFDWCTGTGRGSPGARTLAQIYASTYLGTAHLFRLTDVRALASPQRDWALALIEGYVAGWFTAPYRRALELMELYAIRNPRKEG